MTGNNNIPAPERSKEEVGVKAFADAILDLAKDGVAENDLSFNSGLCAALEAIRPLIDAALETTPLHKEGEASIDRHAYRVAHLPYPDAAPAPVPVTITDELRHAFRNVDESDWQHLFAVLPDTHRGRFWKAVMTEARAALSKPGEQG